MLFRTLTALGLAAFTMLFSSASMAHHSFAMFDIDNRITLTGVVREFQWTNPHVLIWVYVEEDGEDEPVT